MRIFIAKSSTLDNSFVNKAINDIISKFDNFDRNSFVEKDPDIILFLSGEVEPEVLKIIKPEKRYCLLATKHRNSWSAASEVKAFCNEKGVKTRIFDFEALESTKDLSNFLNTDYREKSQSVLGVLGEISPSLIVSYPEENLMEDVLHIKLLNKSFNEFPDFQSLSPDAEFLSFFKKLNFDDVNSYAKVYSALKLFISQNNLDAITINCRQFMEKCKMTPCLPFSILNSMGFPSVCETDVITAAAMIASKRLLNTVPWVANLAHADNERAVFAHCSVPISMTDNDRYEIVPHCESKLNSSIKADIGINQQITVFRIDRQLETCFIARGEITASNSFINSCGTSIDVRLSSKSLFLIREFPLGNHHLILQGNHTDALAEYFSEKGFQVF